MTPLQLHLSPTLRAALALTLAALLGGCGVSSQLHLNDPSTGLMSLRAEHRFSSSPGGGGIEAELSSVRAQGQQVLQPSQSALLNNVTLTGPGDLQHTARLQHAQIAYKHQHFAGRPIELEWFAGAAGVHTAWETVTASGTALRLAHRSRWSGPAAGAQGRLRLGEQLALELRYGVVVNLSNLDLGSLGSTALALAYKPMPGWVLRLGVGEVRSFYRPEFNASELSLRARGPFLNLGLEL